MNEVRDEFLSEEDMDLRNLSYEELEAYWDQWLLQAQATNDRDKRSYSHGVFVMIEEPESGRKARRAADGRADYGEQQIL
ncbi:MAG: hypothetical protein R6V03_03230 [Kiritimatiellia bacterium]